MGAGRVAPCRNGMMTIVAHRQLTVRDAHLPPVPCRAYAMAMSAPLPTSRTDWTVEEVHLLRDDGHRYEVVDGELLVSPAPSYMHQAVVFELAVLLRDYAASIGCTVVIAPAAVTFSQRREVQPDVFVIPLVDGKRPRTFAESGRLELAAEVLSEATTYVDRYTKRRLFQAEYVPDYWIVDTDARVIERWRPNDTKPEQLADTLVWRPRADVEPRVIDLVSYFRRVHGE